MRDFSSLVSAADRAIVSVGSESLAIELKNLKIKEEPRRVQVGFFHVWIRGSNRYNVFYNTDDFVGFLERCDRAAKNNKTFVSAFVLMDNHVHLQIYTHCLNDFMRSLLMSFNQWYNRRKGLSGQLFNSPFCSKLIDDEDYLRYNYLYILTNPVRAGICENITKYRWSSYHFTKKGYYNYLSKFLDINYLVNDFLFKSYNDLHAGAEKHLREFWSFEEVESGVNTNSRQLIRPTDNEVAKYLDFILKGRRLGDITRNELVKTMQVLRERGGATYRQISAVTRVSFYDVIRMLKEER